MWTGPLRTGTDSKTGHEGHREPEQEDGTSPYSVIQRFPTATPIPLETLANAQFQEARQQLEAAHQVPQRSNLPDLEKQESAVLQERHPRAQPVKVVFDDGHEEYISTDAKEKELEYETEAQLQQGENLPRYSEVMKA